MLKISLDYIIFYFEFYLNNPFILKSYYISIKLQFDLIEFLKHDYNLYYKTNDLYKWAFNVYINLVSKNEKTIF